MQIKNKDILFVINSNNKFYRKSLDKIVPSLLNAGIDHSSIMVIIGGIELIDENYQKFKRIQDKFYIDKVYGYESDSCDYTTFNFVADNPNLFTDFNYIFYLHDTCWVGDDFLRLLEEHTPDYPINSYGLTRDWSMNIGLYNIEYLLSNKSDIRKSFNHDNSEQSINRWKQWGALNEDYLMDKTCGNYKSHNQQETITSENPYDSTTTRRTRYFACLDLYKSQSNWNGVQNKMSISL